MNNRTFNATVVFFSLVVVLLTVGVAGNMSKTNTPEYNWQEARSPTTLGWGESGRTSILLGELPECYLMGGFDNEVIVCPTGTVLHPTIPAVARPDVSEVTVTSTPKPKEDKPIIIITPVVTLTNTPNPTETIEPTSTPNPTNTSEPTPKPTGTPEPTKKPKCNKGEGNGSEGCDPGNHPEKGNDDED